MPYTSNIVEDSVISSWSEQPPSIRSSESTLVDTSKLYSGKSAKINRFPPVIINLREQKYEDSANDLSLVTDTVFDVPGFLRSLIKDLAFLEDQVRMKTSVAMESNMSETLSVLTIHSVAMKMRLEATVKELDLIIDTANDTDEAPMEPELQTNDSNFALKWLQVTIKPFKEDAKLSYEKIADVGKTETIETIFVAMKDFQGDEKIENVGSELLNILADPSTMTTNCMNIVNSGGLEYLKDLFVKYWPLRFAKMLQENKAVCFRTSKEDTMTNIFWVFIKISQHLHTTKYLLQNSYFEMFRLPLSDRDFSKYNILAGYLLINLLRIEYWTGGPDRHTVDELLYQNISQWKLRKCLPIRFTSAGYALRTIKHGTKSQQLYCAWRIYNQLLLEPVERVEKMTEEVTLSGVENLFAEPSCDGDVKILLLSIREFLKNRIHFLRDSFT